MADGRSRHLGLDLGGTNLKWAVVERAADEWRTLDTGQVRTAVERGPAGVVSQFGDVGREVMERWDGISTAGVGLPGLYDGAQGTVRFLPNVPGEWAGVVVVGPISDALAIPAALINDARAFGLAELRLGAARGARSMIGLTLGTGVGGVFAVDGRVHQGHDGTGGELGHQTIDPEGPLCGCGNYGCLEAFARADRIAEACGTATVEEAVRRAREGDERSLAGLRQAGRWLGIGIANAIVVVNPDVVVIGGGVAAAGDLLLDPIRGELARRVHITSLEPVRIALAELGTWAGAIGAAIHGAEAAGQA